MDWTRGQSGATVNFRPSGSVDSIPRTPVRSPQLRRGIPSSPSSLRYTPRASFLSPEEASENVSTSLVLPVLSLTPACSMSDFSVTLPSSPYLQSAFSSPVVHAHTALHGTPLEYPRELSPHTTTRLSVSDDRRALLSKLLPSLGEENDAFINRVPRSPGSTNLNVAPFIDGNESLPPVDLAISSDEDSAMFLANSALMMASPKMRELNDSVPSLFGDIRNIILPTPFCAISIDALLRLIYVTFDLELANFSDALLVNTIELLHFLEMDGKDWIFRKLAAPFKKLCQLEPVSTLELAALLGWDRRFLICAAVACLDDERVSKTLNDPTYLFLSCKDSVASGLASFKLEVVDILKTALERTQTDMSAKELDIVASSFLATCGKCKKARYGATLLLGGGLQVRPTRPWERLRRALEDGLCSATSWRGPLDDFCTGVLGPMAKDIAETNPCECCTAARIKGDILTLRDALLDYAFSEIVAASSTAFV